MSQTLRQRVSELEEEVENLWFENEQLRAIAEHCLMGATEPERAKPGIGAVVAMVAAAKVARGEYRPQDGLPVDVKHWRLELDAIWTSWACGLRCCVSADWVGNTCTDPNDATCSACREMGRRAGLMREAT